MFGRYAKISITPEGLKAQAEAFLKANGFEVNIRTLREFAQYIQSLPGNQDYFDKSHALACMRKAQANGAAFCLIWPDKYEEAKRNEEKASEALQQEILGPKEEVG